MISTTIKIVTLFVVVIGGAASTQVQTLGETELASDVCYKDIKRSNCLDIIFKGFCSDSYVDVIQSGCCEYYAKLDPSCVDRLVKKAKAQICKDDDLVGKRARDLQKICTLSLLT